MDKDVKITPEQLAKAMDADYQKLVQLVSGPVEKTRQPVLSLPAVSLSNPSNGFVVTLPIDYTLLFLKNPFFRQIRNPKSSPNAICRDPTHPKTQSEIDAQRHPERAIGESKDLIRNLKSPTPHRPPIDPAVGAFP